MGILLSFVYSNSFFLFFQFFVILLFLVLTEMALILVLSVYHEEVRDYRLSLANISAFPFRKTLCLLHPVYPLVSVLSI